MGRLTGRMRCAIYARVSTTDQKCAMQLTELQGYAERSDWSFVDYVDEGVSGVKARRPALDRLMADGRLKKFDVVICWKLDRFGRSMSNLVENIRELDALGIRFICPTQGIDTNHKSPTGKLILHILAALAEFERELTRERTEAGVKQFRANFKAGRIGKDLHTRSKKDLPIGRPARVFRRDRAVELRSQGLSFRAISKELGVPLGTVHRALNGAK